MYLFNSMCKMTRWNTGMLQPCGKTDGETAAVISRETPPGENAVVNGSAGENLVNLSRLITGVSHCWGGGASIGKAFSSRRLKAIAFHGT